MPNDDIDKLVAASQRDSHIYRVTFEIRVNDKDMGEDGWVQDELHVLAGPDALEAVDKVKVHTAASSYWPEVGGAQEFRLLEVKVLAEADF